MEYRSYRSTGNGFVDESLFGRPHREQRARKTKAEEAVVISKKELSTLKSHAQIWTKADDEKEFADKERAQERKQKAARERKERMLKLEAEAKAKSRKSESEIEREARLDTIRKLASEEQDENLDLVKMLNTLGARAEAFTIRDQQLAEKKEREAKRIEEEKCADLRMEIDRLKELQMRDIADEERRKKRIDDRKVIVEQIERREKRKLLEEEKREQENKAMLSLVKKYQDEDTEAMLKHRSRVEQARREVLAANAEAIERKRMVIERERAEEESVLLYQVRKDEQLRKREFEEKEKERIFKERQAKLLAQQEKTINTQAEVDELRARRYAEARERTERERELAEAQARKKHIQELQEAHRSQADIQKLRKQQFIQNQKQEYEENLREMAQLSKREKYLAEQKAKAAAKHHEVLQKQIEDARASKSSSTFDKREEGRLLKAEFAAERAKLEAIRDKMVADMEKKGINPRYLTEIKAVDISKLQNR